MTTCSKPVRRKLSARVPHGVRPTIVVSIYPQGLIGLRELGRRREYLVDVGALYVREVITSVNAARRERQQKRSRA
jgi:hypothetical protein